MKGVAAAHRPSGPRATQVDRIAVEAAGRSRFETARFESQGASAVAQTRRRIRHSASRFGLFAHMQEPAQKVPAVITTDFARISTPKSVVTPTRLSVTDEERGRCCL
mgnify:CR=1 FL=1